MRLIVKQQAPFQGFGSLSERSEPWKGAVFDYGFEFFVFFRLIRSIIVIINKNNALEDIHAIAPKDLSLDIWR